MAAIVALALVLNLLLLTRVFDGPDAVSYNRFASDAQDWAYWLDPDAFAQNNFPMGYPSLLALTMKMVGGATWLYQALSIAMSIGVVLFSWMLTRHLSRGVRLTTMVAVALSPALLWMTQSNGYEMLIAFLMTAALVLSWRVTGVGVGERGVPRFWGPLAAGACIGLTLLAQSKTLIVVPVLAYLMWQRGRGPLLAFLSASAFLPAVWAIRNASVLGSWSPFSRNGELGFWLGNNPSTVTGGSVDVMPPKPPGFGSLYEAGLNFIVSQPESAYALLLRRLARLLEPTYLYRDLTALPGGQVALHYYAIGFSAVGIVLFGAYVMGRVWTGPPVLPPVGALAAFVLAFWLVHLPFMAEPRYLTPVVPVALAVSVPTGFALLARWRDRPHPTRIQAA